MNIKQLIEDVVGKVTKDKTLIEDFKKNPLETIKSLVDVDLSKDQLNQIVEGVKAKVSLDQAKGVLDQAKDFFKK